MKNILTNYIIQIKKCNKDYDIVHDSNAIYRFSHMPISIAIYRLFHMHVSNVETAVMTLLAYCLYWLRLLFLFGMAKSGCSPSHVLCGMFRITDISYSSISKSNNSIF